MAQRPFASRVGRQRSSVHETTAQRSGAAATLPYLSWISLVPPKRGGFGIAAQVRLRCAFPLDWTHVSYRKYGSESDFGSPVQAQLLALR
ncbi:hypothetical protein HAX54_048646 [Datura stramonium]|uniref:Uncharacterized protein n=1 Tax=Datura stramonium TaxID=4076 RepID=A0ABS8WLF9_DATST|nr:hypothetical protein [Datura stramonium]